MAEPARRVRWVGSTASTQELAHLLAETGVAHGVAIAAREQVAGRGTRGRTWHSPLGGLWMSLVCRPREAASVESLSLRVGLAVVEALEEVLTSLPPLAIKWPNDIHLDGRKLGGILCEARWQGTELGWVVAGIGLNVSNPLPPEVAGTAISLAQVVRGADPETLADPVADLVARRTREGGPLRPDEVAALNRRDGLRDRRIASPLAGVARGIDAGGALRVETPGGEIRAVIGGTVELA